MRKGQIHMMETISVLFIFFILVFIGIIFYTNIARNQFERDIEGFQELSRIKINQIASSLPELQCSEYNDLNSNCIDVMKIPMASQVMEENYMDYVNYFGYSNITIRKVFPDSNEEWQLYLYKKNGSMRRTYFPISLYEPITDSYSFGLMVVEVYS